MYNISSRKLIKSQNLIIVDSFQQFISDKEKDFIITTFNKYFNGLHKHTSISEQALYCIMTDICRVCPVIVFEKDFYVFKDKPCNDFYFTYGFKINKNPWCSSYGVINYILSYISEYYGLPVNRDNKQYKIQITEDKSTLVIGV